MKTLYTNAGSQQRSDYSCWYGNGLYGLKINCTAATRVDINSRDQERNEFVAEKSAPQAHLFRCFRSSPRHRREIFLQKIRTKKLVERLVNGRCSSYARKRSITQTNLLNTQIRTERIRSFRLTWQFISQRSHSTVSPSRHFFANSGKNTT